MWFSTFSILATNSWVCSSSKVNILSSPKQKETEVPPSYCIQLTVQGRWGRLKHRPLSFGPGCGSVWPNNTWTTRHVIFPWTPSALKIALQAKDRITTIEPSRERTGGCVPNHEIWWHRHCKSLRLAVWGFSLIRPNSACWWMEFLYPLWPLDCLFEGSFVSITFLRLISGGCWRLCAPWEPRDFTAHFCLCRFGARDCFNLLKAF